ncbi:M55 family metallopeptidase [Pantoea agglomerans]|uniref:M55 family metallopeptidase n=1 Tax=Enterobacter agglomerans TaxID=549 RepID=UPI002739630E|nr:M55 family metallopeptidase [Pantoea agglomerans]WLO83215.1 M55 family metallopeptidase [Pantoea agglomerans]
MKIFISADIEGIAGVMRPEQCTPGHPEHQLARGLMEQEVNAAIEGAFAGGATEVVVADSHAQMTNLRAENIDPRARLVQGKPRVLSMVEGIEQQTFDGLFLVGFHSAAGEPGVLAHTINGRAFWRIHINGLVMGETDIYAASAAEHGTPLLLVTGDDQLQSWIAEHYSAVNYVCVKRAISHTCAESFSPQAAQRAIAAAASAALQHPPQVNTSRLTAPYAMRLQATKPVLADLFSLIPGVTRLDAVTVAYQAENMETLISLLSAFSYLASTQS